jgi:carbamoyl-phosphate synthase large subunit
MGVRRGLGMNRVLMVCRGNICRSPIAAAVLANLQPTWQVDSAGTGTWHLGKPADPRACAIAGVHGLDLAAHRARRVTAADFHAYDRVLAMDGRTLEELRPLIPAAPGALIGLLPDFDPLGCGAIDDPYHGDESAFISAYTAIERCCRALAERPRATSGPPRRRTVLLEASGSLVSAWMISAVRAAGHRCVASDIDADAVGRYLADSFAIVPRQSDPALWTGLAEALRDHGVDAVIPSLDESLLGWAERRDAFAAAGVQVVVSDPDTIRTCTDKWLTWQLFRRLGIPAPEASLEQRFELVKPRHGRGAQGIVRTCDPVAMDGMMSQEFVEGVEYTVDVCCSDDGTPLHIVPRRRLRVQGGKSTGGVTEEQPAILDAVRRLAEGLRFRGPFNAQCIVRDGTPWFIEINPRIAGGMALGFAATENWIPLLLEGRRPTATPRWGLRMHRHYAEVFTP